MPVLTNPKHERFAQAIAKGLGVGEAYLDAGYSQNDGNASRLKGDERIKARVAEIQGKVAERVVRGNAMSRDWVLEQLADNVRQAKEAGKFEASNTALKLIGSELHSMFVTKQETGSPGDFAARMTDDELRRHIEDEARALGIDAAGVAATQRPGKTGPARRFN